MTWFLDLRASSVGGVTSSEVVLRQGAGRCTDLRGFLEQVQGRDVLLGTHGFNVNRLDGVASLSKWESLLTLGPNAVFIGILWPGDSRWMPVLDYPFEDQEAITSALLLAPFLNRYFNEAASLSFVSHSLGARMVLETIKRIDPNLNVIQAILMAGAINDDCLSQEYKKKVTTRLKDVSVLASLSDRVLEVAFPLGNPLAGIITQGHPYWRGALGRYGPQRPRPDNLDSAWQIPGAWGYGHGNYLGGDPPKRLPPITLPGISTDVPASKPGWSAGFVSTHFRNTLDR